MNFGFAHQPLDSWQEPGDSELALRCVVCPRPGVNLPVNWESEPDQWKYYNSYTMDVNFEAQHTKSRVPANNVQLAPGTGFFPDPEKFRKATSFGIDDSQLDSALVTSPLIIS
jgi:hypothetical protein